MLDYYAGNVIESFLRKQELRKAPLLSKRRKRGLNRNLCVSSFEHYMTNYFSQLVEQEEVRIPYYFLTMRLPWPLHSYLKERLTVLTAPAVT